MRVIKMEVGMLGTNCYLVINEELHKGVVIDPGGDGDRILECIRQERVDIEAILLTHGHSDHIMALDELREATQANVYISQEDASMLVKPAGNLSIYMGEGASFRPADIIFKDGEILNVAGIEFKVLATPGHTKGGVCLVAENTVFCGDTIFAESIGRTDLPGGSYNQILDSIRNKILVLPDEVNLLPGHGPSTTVGWERRRNPFLQ